MEILPIKTRKLLPPQDDLFAVLEESLPALHEGDVVCIASKVVAIHQGRVVSCQSVVGSEKTKNNKQKDGDAPLLPKADKGDWGDLDDEKRKIILSEAEWVDDVERPFLTIKNGQFIPFAGVDESNGNGHYILWPEDPMGVARKVRDELCAMSRVHDLGVVITDSTCLPLRNGTVGTAIGFAGFNPIRDYRGKGDLFGRTMELSRVNVADGFAAAATLVMGEGSESTPIAIIRGAEGVEFTEKDHSQDVRIAPEEDIFGKVLVGLKGKSPQPPLSARRLSSISEVGGSLLRIVPEDSDGERGAGTAPPLPAVPSDWLDERPFFTLVAVTSLDGVIAPEPGKSVDWASREDQEWFHRLLPTFDATVLGRKTYRGVDALSKRNRVVLTSSVESIEQKDEHTWFVNPANGDLLGFLMGQGWKNVGVTGGGETYSFFLKNGWADRLLLTVEPLIFGGGVRLFSGETHERFRLVRMTRLNVGGTMLCQYDRIM